MPFTHFNLHESILQTIRHKRFERPTPIQTGVIPAAMDGRDVFGCAQTGTGKTAAFALPILQRLNPVTSKGRRPIRSLILAPTRELAAQIGETFGEFGRRSGLRHTVVFGGVNQRPQCRDLRQGVDILVATPGRLLDLMGQGEIELGRVEILVLDEADRMLDMGFIKDIERVIARIPQNRQTMFFSATMPPAIDKLARRLMDNPERVVVTPKAPAAETVEQSVRFVEKGDKLNLLRGLLGDEAVTKAIVFTRTKHGADKVARKLNKAGVRCEAMHSGKSQNQRLRILDGFRTGRMRVLAASDIAARGLDVDDITHVVNYDMPAEAETYVHRIGRTGRAGTSGRAVAFCSKEERPLLRQIESLLSRKLPAVDIPLAAPLAPSAMPAKADTPKPAPRGKRKPPRQKGMVRGTWSPPPTSAKRAKRRKRMTEGALR